MLTPTLTYNSVVNYYLNFTFNPTPVYVVFCSNCTIFYGPVDQSFIVVIFFSSNIAIRENVIKTVMILLIIFPILCGYLA